jgi:hypothetical protein
MDLTEEITRAIAQVMAKLGADSEGIDLTDSQAVNRVLKEHGADIYVMCAIGSWRDTMTDEDVLQDLNAWLRDGESALRPDTSFS